MKQTYLRPEELRPLTDDVRLCYASGSIIADGYLIGYMTREPPAFPSDSGWRFFAGGEAPKVFKDQMSNFYPLNVICNYDPEILPLLDAPIGASFVRKSKGLTDIRELALPEKYASAVDTAVKVDIYKPLRHLKYRVRPRRIHTFIKSAGRKNVACKRQGRP